MLKSVQNESNTRTSLGCVSNFNEISISISDLNLNSILVMSIIVCYKVDNYTIIQLMS